MNQTSALFYHRLVESFKWAYGARTRLGDPSDPEYGPGVAATVIMTMIVMMMMMMIMMMTGKDDDGAAVGPQQVSQH